MRLALIRQRYNPYGGAERFIERAIAALEGQGAEVTLVTRAWHGEGRRRALVVDPWYAGSLWRDLSFARGARAALENEQFDLVQSHERIAGFDVYRAGDGVHRQWLDHRLAHAGTLERLGIRLNPFHRYVCAAEKAMYEHPALRAVICNSHMVAGEIRRHFAVDAGKLHVIRNGVDLDHFHPAKRHAMREAARRELGCGPGETLFAFVGSGFARKGLGTVIAALADCGRADFRLAVAGSDRKAARFVEQAERAQVARRVHMLGGREDVRPLYAAADCFILPTRYDPFPNAALEALAMGLPVIVSSRCGVAELVEAGASGWICEPDSTHQLARLMVEAAAASGERMSTAAREAAQACGVEQMAGRMLELYARLLADSVTRETDAS